MLRHRGLGIVGLVRRRARSVVNHLPSVLATRGLGWGELARRTLLSPRNLRLLRLPEANPRIGTATRIAAALDLPVERLWTLDHEET